MTPDRAYGTFFEMMLTNALVEHEGWILKGGTNLLCRLGTPGTLSTWTCSARGTPRPPPVPRHSTL